MLLLPLLVPCVGVCPVKQLGAPASAGSRWRLLPRAGARPGKGPRLHALPRPKSRRPAPLVLAPLQRKGVLTPRRCQLRSGPLQGCSALLIWSCACGLRSDAAGQSLPLPPALRRPAACLALELAPLLLPPRRCTCGSSSAPNPTLVTHRPAGRCAISGQPSGWRPPTRTCGARCAGSAVSACLYLVIFWSWNCRAVRQFRSHCSCAAAMAAVLAWRERPVPPSLPCCDCATLPCCGCSWPRRRRSRSGWRLKRRWRCRTRSRCQMRRVHWGWVVLNTTERCRRGECKWGSSCMEHYSPAARAATRTAAWLAGGSAATGVCVTEAMRSISLST